MPTLPTAHDCLNRFVPQIDAGETVRADHLDQWPPWNSVGAWLFARGRIVECCQRAASPDITNVARPVFRVPPKSHKGRHHQQTHWPKRKRSLVFSETASGWQR